MPQGVYLKTEKIETNNYTIKIIQNYGLGNDIFLMRGELTSNQIREITEKIMEIFFCVKVNEE